MFLSVIFEKNHFNSSLKNNEDLKKIILPWHIFRLICLDTLPLPPFLFALFRRSRSSSLSFCSPTPLRGCGGRGNHLLLPIRILADDNRIKQRELRAAGRRCSKKYIKIKFKQLNIFFDNVTFQNDWTVS